MNYAVSIKDASQSEKEIQLIDDQMKEYRQYREGCLNLIASENVVSPFVLNHLGIDLESRYGDYIETDLTNRKYRGTKPLIPIEQTAIRLISEIFRAKYVDLRPLSGHIAGAAALLALCKPGDVIMELDKFAGGHRVAEKLSLASLIDLQIVPVPFDATTYNIDTDATIKAIKKSKPKVVILGSSLFLFPHPITRIAEAIKKMGNCWLLYDASHVLGLIAGGMFQNPLGEGADLIVSSTHKTFAGPQGGMILTNNSYLAKLVASSICPALVANHHLSRIPAMAARAIEIKAYGYEYAKATILNAKALGEALQDYGLQVVGSKSGFTESHTVLIQTDKFGNCVDIAARLEQSGVICGEVSLPEAIGKGGLRLGVQELTRLGLKPTDTKEIAEIIAAIIYKKVSTEKAVKIVIRIAERFKKICFAIE
jgi:glycine hydroxymethyltransferase